MVTNYNTLNDDKAFAHQVIASFLNQIKMINTEEFECYLINILDSDELTDTEKVQLIKEQF